MSLSIVLRLSRPKRHFAGKLHHILIDVLEDTRAHPEDYDIARKMAADALVNDAAGDVENPHLQVVKIMVNEADRLLMLILTAVFGSPQGATESGIGYLYIWGCELIF